MENVEIYNGTNKAIYSDLVKIVLSELPTNKTTEEVIDAKEIVKELEDSFYDIERNQVNLDSFIDIIEKASKDSNKKIFLLDKDLYANNVNWCYGITIPENLSIISDNRFQNNQGNVNLNLFYKTITHEIGHLFGAPSDGRTNTQGYEPLGLHCTNYCVMQTVNSLNDLNRIGNKYCPQCLDDIKK